MKRFATIVWLDNAILYSLELVASVSVLFLAVGLIASVANVLTGGEVISSSEIGKQFYAWSQAIGIDASIPGVIMRLVIYGKQKEWFRCGVYTVLSVLVLFTAFNISNVESMTQTLNTPLTDGYAHSLVSLDVLVTIRSLTVILLIVSHARKHLHADVTPTVKGVKPKVYRQHHNRIPNLYSLSRCNPYNRNPKSPPRGLASPKRRPHLFTKTLIG